MARGKSIPYVRPGAGAQLDWPSYAPLLISAPHPKNYSVPYVYNFNLNVQRSLPLEHGSASRLCRLHRTAGSRLEGDPITPAGHAACLPIRIIINDSARLHHMTIRSFLATGHRS